MTQRSWLLEDDLNILDVYSISKILGDDLKTMENDKQPKVVGSLQPLDLGVRASFVSKTKVDNEIICKILELYFRFETRRLCFSAVG